MYINIHRVVDIYTVVLTNSICNLWNKYIMRSNSRLQIARSLWTQRLIILTTLKMLLYLKDNWWTCFWYYNPIMTIIDYNRCHRVTLVILTRLNIRNKRDTCEDGEATNERWTKRFEQLDVRGWSSSLRTTWISQEIVL